MVELPRLKKYPIQPAHNNLASAIGNLIFVLLGMFVIYGMSIYVEGPQPCELYQLACYDYIKLECSLAPGAPDAGK